MKSIIFWLLALGCAAAVSSPLPDTVAAIRESVVAVGVTRARQPGVNQPSFEYRATGFAVGNGTQVVTNYHVVAEHLEGDGAETLVVFVGRGEVAQVRPATVLHSDPARDLAVLAIGGAPLPTVRLGDHRSVREGEDVAFTGFPIGMVLGLYPVTGRAIVAAIAPIAIPALTSQNLTAAQIQRLRSPFDIYQIDAIAYPGNSGSPVYRPDTGEVIGVINSVFVKDTKEAVLASPSGITYAIPVKYLEALLDQK